MKREENTIQCELCGRYIPSKKIERHHFEPKNKRKKYGINNVALVCHPCGDQIHLLFSNKELETTYNTIDKLIESPSIQKWIEWIRKTNHSTVCMKTKKKR